jgi:serine protease Do
MRHPLLVALIVVACTCRAPTPDTPQDLDALASRIEQVVHIEACSAAGSGVNLGNGYALTALHVVVGCSAYVVTESISERASTGELDLAHRFDVARIKLEDTVPSRPVTIARVVPGQTVCAMVAHPLLLVRCGHVRSVAEGRGGIEHSVPVDKGNSGGGLYDTSGNLVGIIVTCNLTEGVCNETGGGATPLAGMEWLLQ